MWNLMEKEVALELGISLFETPGRYNPYLGLLVVPDQTLLMWLALELGLEVLDSVIKVFAVDSSGPDTAREGGRRGLSTSLQWTNIRNWSNIAKISIWHCTFSRYKLLYVSNTFLRVWCCLIIAGGKRDAEQKSWKNTNQPMLTHVTQEIWKIIWFVLPFATKVEMTLAHWHKFHQWQLSSVCCNFQDKVTIAQVMAYNGQALRFFLVHTAGHKRHKQ